jgi:hypothetical protein
MLVISAGIIRKCSAAYKLNKSLSLVRIFLYSLAKNMLVELKNVEVPILDDGIQLDSYTYVNQTTKLCYAGL